MIYAVIWTFVYFGITLYRIGDARHQKSSR